MRLSGVEAVARNPISVTGGVQGVSDYGGIAGLAAGGMAAAFAYPPPPPPAEYGYDAAAGGGMEYGPAGGGGGGGGGGGVYGMQEAYSSTAPPVLSTPAGAGGAGPSSDAQLEVGSQQQALGRAVDAKLKELVPTIHAQTTIAAATAGASTPAAEAPASAGGSEFGLPSSSRKTGAAALRISRQELDQRVQQILGRHGQSL